KRTGSSVECPARLWRRRHFLPRQYIQVIVDGYASEPPGGAPDHPIRELQGASHWTDGQRPAGPPAQQTAECVRPVPRIIGVIVAPRTDEVEVVQQADGRPVQDADAFVDLHPLDREAVPLEQRRHRPMREQTDM